MKVITNLHIPLPGKCSLATTPSFHSQDKHPSVRCLHASWRHSNLHCHGAVLPAVALGLLHSWSHHSRPHWSAILRYVLYMYMYIYYPSLIHIVSLLYIHPVVCFAIGIGVFVDLDQSFAGFFSINGVEQEGCLSYGFGIALAAFIINILATVIGSVAICYRKAKPNREAVYLRK